MHPDYLYLLKNDIVFLTTGYSIMSLVTELPTFTLMSTFHKERTLTLASACNLTIRLEILQFYYVLYCFRWTLKTSLPKERGLNLFENQMQHKFRLVLRPEFDTKTNIKPPEHFLLLSTLAHWTGFFMECHVPGLDNRLHLKTIRNGLL